MARVFGADPLALLDWGSWHYDIDSDRIVASPDWHRITGCGSVGATLTVADLARVIHPDDVGAATFIDTEALKTLAQGPARYATAFRVVHDDGTTRELRSIARLYLDPVGGHRCAAGYVFDVTPGARWPLIRPETKASVRCGSVRPAQPLSESERDCLAWAGHGKTAWETAQIMGLSPRTIEFHLANAITKLSATNKAHATAIAVRMGLI
jgi:DNA-binding CsgD family transcriptional regulator